MTDRINGFTVILKKEARQDDFEATKDAVLMIRGVARIVPHVTTGSDYIAVQQMKHNLYVKIFNFLQELFK